MRPAPIPRLEVPDLTERVSPTEREIAILECAARGLNASETARELFVAPQTIKFHKSNLYRKLGARSIGHAIAIGYRRGLLRLEGDDRAGPVVVVDGVRYVPADE